MDNPAKMQWWYYDFLSNDGSIGVLVFIPYKWWPGKDSSEIDKSLVMFSLYISNGRIVRYSKEVDSDQFSASPDRLMIGDCLTLDYKVEIGTAYHELKFDLGEVIGTLRVHSTAPPFSAIPLGSLSAVARKLAYRAQWSRSSFRYVSQIPRGRVTGDLKMDNETISISGHVYHEQGWFDNEPHLLNHGWYWYHFLHPECNLFGLPEGYAYVQLNDETLLGGMCLMTKKYWMEPRRYENPRSPKILTGGVINLAAMGMEIEIHLDSSTNQDLIEFSSFESAQLWNTSLVESTCSISLRGKDHDFSGKAMVETCWLEK